MQLEVLCGVSHCLAVGIRSAGALVVVWSESRWTGDMDQAEEFALTLIKSENSRKSPAIGRRENRRTV
jgi:hypothetical protein